MYAAAVDWQRTLHLFVRAERDIGGGRTRFGIKASSAGHRTVGGTRSSADRGLRSDGSHCLDRPSPSSQQVDKWFQRQHRVGPR